MLFLSSKVPAEKWAEKSEDRRPHLVATSF